MSNVSTNYDDNNWEVERDFCKNDIVVRVTKLFGHRTRYSIQIGRMNDVGKFVRHFGLYCDNKSGTIQLRRSVANDIALLVAEAEAYAESLYQSRENELKLNKKLTTE